MLTFTRSFSIAITIAVVGLIGCNKFDLATTPDSQNSVHLHMSKTFTYADTIVDSAMVIIEENLNHDFGDATYNFGDIVIDSAAYTFDVSGLTINEEYALSDDEQEMIRDTLIDWIERYADRVDTTQLSGHAIILVDVSSWQMIYASDNYSISLDISMVIGENVQDIDCEEWYKYGSNDYWMFYGDFGGCQSNPATSGDAASIMTSRLNSYVSSGQCQLSCERKGYYSYVETRDYSHDGWPNPNETHPQDLDGYLDYLLWTNKYESPQSMCIEPDEMEFHTQGAITISYGQFKPSGIVGVIQVYGYHIIGSGYDAHGFSASYGKLNCK